MTGVSMIQTRKRPTCQRGEGLRGPKAKEAPAAMRREGSTIQRRGRPPHQRGMGLNGPNVKEARAPMQHGLNDPNVQEAPGPTRQGSPWSQREGRPHAHASGAMMVPK